MGPVTCLSAATKDWAMRKQSSGLVRGPAPGPAARPGENDTKSADPLSEKTEADWSILKRQHVSELSVRYGDKVCQACPYPPEFTPTARSLTMASSVSSVLSTDCSPLATKTLNALVLVKAALELSPPPAGPVPSIRTCMLLHLKSPPCFFRRSSNAPRSPLLKKLVHSCTPASISTEPKGMS